MGIAPSLDHDVEHMAVLIDRAPKIAQLATDADEHLAEASLVAGPWTSPLQLVGEQPTETQAPLTDGLIADHDAAGGQDGFDITWLRLKQ